jgi:hypothetical protein
MQNYSPWQYPIYLGYTVFIGAVDTWFKEPWKDRVIGAMRLGLHRFFVFIPNLLSLSLKNSNWRRKRADQTIAVKSC